MKRHPKTSLRAVKNWRAEVERMRTVDLQNSRSELEKRELALQCTRNDKDLLMDDFQRIDVSKIDLNLAFLQVAMDYMQQLNTEISDREDRVGKAERIVEENLNSLIEAAKEKKVIEKLDERKAAETKRGENSKEIKQESETALRMAASHSTEWFER